MAANVQDTGSTGYVPPSSITGERARRSVAPYMHPELLEAYRHGARLASSLPSVAEMRARALANGEVDAQHAILYAVVVDGFVEGMRSAMSQARSENWRDPDSEAYVFSPWQWDNAYFVRLAMGRTTALQQLRETARASPNGQQAWLLDLDQRVRSLAATR